MKDKFEIIKVPEMEIELKEKQIFNTDDVVLLEIINNFTKILERNFMREDLQLFYSNIGTLKMGSKSIILEILLSLFKEKTSTGLYFLKENKISVLPLENSTFISKRIGISKEEYIANMFHELLHMSATITNSKCKTILSGFCQSGKTNIGIALDDGYVELLLHRYFGVKNDYITYVYENIISSLVEKIVTKEIMTSLYFKADLYNLVLELEKYSDINEVENFIKDLDIIYYLQDYSKHFTEDIIYHHNNISSFLVDSYQRKLNDDLNNRIITSLGYKKRLNEYLKSMHKAFTALEVQNKTLVKKR